MAEKVLQTRIINKHADLATWESSILQLKEGEIALAKLNVAKPDGGNVDTFIAKIGVEGKTFAESPWLYAKASDVYGWAKAEVKPGYTSTEIARGEKSTVEVDLKAAEDAIAALQSKVGKDNVANAIEAAIQALDGTVSGDGTIVKSVVQADGKVTVTMGKLSVDEIPELEISKITGLQEALNAKATTQALNDATAALDVKIQAAAQAAGDAQTYAEGVNTELTNYKTANDAALAQVEATAEAAQTAQEVSDAIDAKIGTYNTATVAPLADRVTVAETAIATEKGRAEAAEGALNGRLTTVEGKVNALSSATHFLGVKDKLADVDAPVAGDIVIVGNKEYVYDTEKGWVELGDTTAELEAIDALENAVEELQAELSTTGDTTKAIAAAQEAADTANDAIAVLNGDAQTAGSVAKAVADALVEAKKDSADKDAVVLAEAQSYADGVAGTAKGAADAAKDAADAAQADIDEHIKDKENPHGVTAEQVGLGKVENKTVAEIKTQFTGEVAQDNAGFVTGGAVYSAVEGAKSAANSYTDGKVKTVADDLDVAEADISTIKATYARVKGDQLVFGQGDNEMVIIFDCGGAN